jgi:hypothetical protein
MEHDEVKMSLDGRVETQMGIRTALYLAEKWICLGRRDVVQPCKCNAAGEKGMDADLGHDVSSHNMSSYSGDSEGGRGAGMCSIL